MDNSVFFYYSILSPPCRVVLMVFRELGISFNPVLIDFSKNEQKSKWFLKLNSRGQVPVIKDGDLILTESRAIIVYLAREYGKNSLNPLLYPEENAIRSKVDEMIALDAELFMKMSYYVNNKEVWHENGGPKAENKQQALSALRTYEDILNGSLYVAANHLTVADFTALATVTFIEQPDFTHWDDYPCIVRWMRRLSSLPQYTECWETPHIQLLGMFKERVKKNRQLKSKL